MGDDPARILASIGERRLRLELSTLELGFLTLLHLRAVDGSISAFDETQLMDAFECACNSLEPTAENVRTRATHTLRRLREQQLLTRVDSSGVVRAGQYALSRLALGILDYYLEDDILTRESLSLLTSTLSATLAQALGHANALADGPMRMDADSVSITWRDHVSGPLTVTCRELLSAIEKRQRGLDQRQEQFQREISGLLAADWFGSLEQCQSLLDMSAEALRELNGVLLRDTHHLHTLLNELAELADENGERDVALATAHLSEQVDRIGSWGSARQKAWSDYYEYVHRYLRDVVRLDPARALSQRLRQQLVEHGQRAFSLTVASSAGLRVLREPQALPAPPPVRRPRKTRDTALTEQEPEADPIVELEADVRALMELGITDLSEVTARLTSDLDTNVRFLVAGRIAEVFARMKQKPTALERPWVDVGADLSIEQRRASAGGNGVDGE